MCKDNNLKNVQFRFGNDYQLVCKLSDLEPLHPMMRLLTISQLVINMEKI